jgi:hypothetical protein
MNPQGTLNMEFQKIVILFVILFCIIFISHGLCSNNFYAYYTKLPSNFGLLEDYQEKLFGKYSDLIIQVGEKGKIVFSRNTSYLPIWQTGKSDWPFPESVPRSGDGPAQRPDILSKYSHVRLIKQSADTIIVHWRYFPDMKYVEWDGVVEEYFKITPDMKVKRFIKKGTATTKDWNNNIGKTYQIFQLSDNGISLLSEKTSKITAESPKPEKRSKWESTVNPELKAWFSFDTDEEGDSEYISDLVSGQYYKIEGHKALWRKGVSGTALQFDGYYSGISVPSQQKFDNPELLSLEGWFALTAYPFDWAPLIHQSEWNDKGFYLGINSSG